MKDSTWLRRKNIDPPRIPSGRFLIGCDRKTPQPVARADCPIMGTRRSECPRRMWNGAVRAWRPVHDSYRVSPFWAMGGARMGGLSWSRTRFSISICDTRMLGEMAETGTQPDSAPHVPLNTAGSSAV